MLQNEKSDVIEDLKEQFNESIYLIVTKNAQEKLLQHGINNKVDELFKVGPRSHALLDNNENEMLIIIKNDIIEFKDKQTMY
jgi:hypothetical protein